MVSSYNSAVHRIERSYVGLTQRTIAKASWSDLLAQSIQHIELVEPLTAQRRSALVKGLALAMSNLRTAEKTDFARRMMAFTLEETNIENCFTMDDDKDMSGSYGSTLNGLSLRYLANCSVVSQVVGFSGYRSDPTENSHFYEHAMTRDYDC